MEYAYYPGCSLEATNPMYDVSLKAVAKVMDIKLNEIKDWNCCGATSYMGIEENVAFTISARNLALAEKMKMDIVAPCSACFCNLSKTNMYLKEFKELNEKVNNALNEDNLSYSGSIKVKHALDIFVNDIGYDKVKTFVKNPLSGLKIAPYYGCQIVRPKLEFHDDPHSPDTLDKLIETCGGECVPYSLKTYCCSGAFMITTSEAGIPMTMKILNNAVENGADVIVTTCPLCQVNLDAYQSEINRKYNTNLNIPILFFTQMVGLAMGLGEKDIQLKKLLTSPFKALSKITKEAVA